MIFLLYKCMRRNRHPQCEFHTIEAPVYTSDTLQPQKSQSILGNYPPFLTIACQRLQASYVHSHQIVLQSVFPRRTGSSTPPPFQPYLYDPAYCHWSYTKFCRSLLANPQQPVHLSSFTSRSMRPIRSMSSAQAKICFDPFTVVPGLTKNALLTTF